MSKTPIRHATRNELAPAIRTIQTPVADPYGGLCRHRVQKKKEKTYRIPANPGPSLQNTINVFLYQPTATFRLLPRKPFSSSKEENTTINF